MKHIIINTFKYIIVFFITIIISIYFISIIQVFGESMEPTYNNGTVFLLNKFHYKIFDIKRNDIITFTSSKEQNLIKRIIGLPGEVIEYKNNNLYVNKKHVPDHISNTITEDFSLKDIPGNYEIIPENMYLVLGDNRNDSYDSRDFGLIHKSDIIGKCSFPIWPF